MPKDAIPRFLIDGVEMSVYQKGSIWFGKWRGSLKCFGEIDPTMMYEKPEAPKIPEPLIEEPEENAEKFSVMKSPISQKNTSYEAPNLSVSLKKRKDFDAPRSEEIVFQYTQKYVSIPVLAQCYGVSKQRIHQILRKAGIKGERTKWRDSQMIEQYEQGITEDELAKQYSLTLFSIHQILRRNSIEIRLVNLVCADCGTAFQNKGRRQYCNDCQKKRGNARIRRYYERKRNRA